jgi:hypothetical protein
VIEMTPPQLHINLLELLRAGLPRINTVGAPGAQGAAVTGTQGCGVSTPKAAVVAAATCGLLKVVHIKKGMMFFIGMLSIMVAAGIAEALTIFSGVTIRLLGAVPKLHASNAPLHTCCPIFSPHYTAISLKPALLSFRAKREIFTPQALQSDLEDFSSFLVEMTAG